MIRKPFALSPGATLGVIAPASPAKDPACVARGIKVLEDLGFKAVLARNALKKNKYLAGTEQERLADLTTMFEDPRVDGIICLRGGYGCIRILPGIDYRIIRRNPKILVGYSDVTALQLAIWKRTGLVTFSGPMLTTDLGNEPGNFTVSQFYKALTLNGALGVIPPAPGLRPWTVCQGRAGGRLVGGNLSLVAATLGTPYEIDTRRAILFLEEVDEQPYRVDRLLRQLLLAGKFNSVVGVVFGECIRCEAKEGEISFTLAQVIGETFARLKIPCFYGLGAGHGAHKATLPLGVMAEMDASNCLLAITESATVA